MKNRLYDQKHGETNEADRPKIGDVITFGWNHILHGPSCIMAIKTIVKDINGVPTVPVPIRKAGAETTEFVPLDTLIEDIEYYLPDVIPIKIIKGDYQTHIFLD